MKKFLKKHILLLCFTITLFLQKTSAQVDTSTTQKLLQYIFQNIDKTQIPTNFFLPLLASNLAVVVPSANNK